MSDPSFDRRLGRWLRYDQRSAAEPAVHIDDLRLAAYLERTLDARARAEVEAHLSSCAACRALALAASSALEPIAERDAPSTAAPAARGWRRPLLSAATVLLALGAGLGWWAFEEAETRHTLAELGVARGRLAALDRGFARAVREAAGGSWPAVAGVDAFAATAPLVRGSRRAPEPLRPRWSATRASRPPTLSWRGDGGATVERYEVLVVDGAERLVGSFAVPPAAGSVTTLAMPVPLAAGVYAWTVSAHRDDGIDDAPYVPFTVLDAEGEADLEAALQAAGDSAFLRAVAFARAGLVDDGLASLATLPPTPARQAAARALLAGKRLPPAVAGTELDRLLAPPPATENPP